MAAPAIHGGAGDENHGLMAHTGFTDIHAPPESGSSGRTRVGTIPDLLPIQKNHVVQSVVPHPDVEGFSDHVRGDHQVQVLLTAMIERDVTIFFHTELERPVVDMVLYLEDRRPKRLDDGVGATPLMLGALRPLCFAEGLDAGCIRTRVVRILLAGEESEDLCVPILLIPP